MVIVALVAILIVADIIATSSSTTVSTILPGMRAVIVPTADATRTVVILPCGTGAAVVSANPTASLNTTGAVAVEFPQGQGTRLVLVPKCTTGPGGVTGTSFLPSAAFVPKPGTAPPPLGGVTASSSSSSSSSGSSSSSSASAAGAPDTAQLQLALPTPSPIRTIVVSPCEKPKVSGPAEVILGAATGSTTAVAPSC